MTGRGRARAEDRSGPTRPHPLTRARPAWTARIRRLTPLGGTVRLEMSLHDGTTLLVQLTRERCLELNLAEGESVYVTPKDMKIFHDRASFVEDYVI